ncbi:MAG: ATP-binding protein [Thermodesulfobacteriota bacterium]
MRVRTRLLLAVGAVVIVSLGVIFLQTAAFMKELVMGMAERQARMLASQVLLTRQWVADHNGLFFSKAPGVEPNPFLTEPEMVDAAGRRYVLRNPAMVTRELSEYAAKAGFGRFRVASLAPVNPANAPDPFERQALERTAAGAQEVIGIEAGDQGRTLRYLTPLMVEEPCLECHRRHGYRLGDVKGGLSLAIPLAWADEAIAGNNRRLLAMGAASVLLVGLTIFGVVDLLVGRRLALLARAMERFPEQDPAVQLPTGSDEVGSLAACFQRLAGRLAAAQEELGRARERLFRNEKLAALGRLAAGVAHEINNPLGGMRNCVQSLQEAPEDRELAARYLPLLDKGLRQIGGIVRQLLNFGRTEPLRRRAVVVDELVRESLLLLGHQLKKGIEVRLDLAAGSPYPLDVEAVKQVLVNIAVNAIQAMPDGGTLAIETRLHDRGLTLTVTDSGAGISPADLPRIFDPFFTTKEVGQGTGLGLALSHSLVQRLGGSISVTSTLGQGSRFVVELPPPASGEAGS